MSNQPSSISIQDIASYIKQLFRFAIKNIKSIIFLGVLGGALGLGLAFLKKPTYKSYLSFLINENESTPVNLSSLAGLAGLGNIGGGSVNEDKLMFLTLSRYVTGSAMLRKVDVGGKPTCIGNLFIDTYDLSKSFANDTALNGFTYFVHAHIDSLTYQENKALDIILKLVYDAKMLKIEGKKKTGLVAQNAGIVMIDFVSLNENLSKVYVDELYKVLSEHYINKTIQRQLKNYNLIKHRADSLKLVLGSKESTGAEMVDQNLNLAKMKAKVKLERTRRDVEMLNLMYAEVLKNMEIAKFNLESQTPMLQLVDMPTYPLKMVKASKILYTLVGGILMAVAGFLFLLVKHYTKHQTL